MEVFPALSIPSMAPSFLNGGKAPKYNPKSPMFRPVDWAQLIFELSTFAETIGCFGALQWLKSIDKGKKPKKEEQDLLDAVICMLIAVSWRKLPTEVMLMIGDVSNGYMVTNATGKAREILINSALRQNVSLDGQVR